MNYRNEFLRAGALMVIVPRLLLGAEAIPSFGLPPLSFPRDTVEFETYSEQMAIGQVIEPLVSNDQYGNITPALADKWAVLENGTLLRFHLRPRAVYSSGAPVTTKDVVASLTRHWKDSKSQSHPLLSNIRDIRSVPDDSIEIRLARPQVAIFKILGRDHLGIQPASWKFSRESTEPYIGSGPYRLLRKAAGWHYIKNSRYSGSNSVAIKEWRLVFSPASAQDLDKLPALPDYAPALRRGILEALKRHPGFDPARFSVYPRFSFAQMSAWWNPSSAGYADASSRRIKMGAVRALFARRRVLLQVQPALGIIPQGVPGHQLKEVVFPEMTRQEIESLSASDPKRRTIRVAVPERITGEIFEPTNVAAVERSLGVSFVLEIRPGFASPPSEADIVIDLWAGGFNDPEGFIPIITDITNLPLDKYLSSLWPLYLEASTELDWTKRSELFRRFDRELVAEERLVPGWKTEFYTILRNNLVEAEGGFRYTPRLLDMSRK